MSDYYKKVWLDSGRSTTKNAFFFNSLADLQRFGTETIDNYPTTKPNFNVIENYKTQNIQREVERYVSFRGDSWYGTTETNWANQPITQFIRSGDLDNDIQNLNQQIGRVDIIDIDQQKKLEFTEKEIGIFSFDLASLGLIRVYEYYSPLTKSLVDANLVQSYKNEKDEQIFYYIGTPFIPRHEVFFNLKEGGYYSEILGRKVETSDLEEVVPDNPDLPIQFFYPEKMEIPRHDVERRQVVDEKGNKKFASTFKKCFIHIPKVKGSLPRIDLIVPVTYASRVSAQEIYWNTLSVLSVCEKLNRSAINFRLIICIGIRNDRNQENFIFCNLKNDNENVDRNAIATAISDARFFRTGIFKLGWSAQIDSGWERNLDSGIGRPIDDQRTIKREYLDYLSQQLDPSDLEASRNPNSKLVVQVARNEQQAIQSYQNLIDQIAGQLII